MTAGGSCTRTTTGCVDGDDHINGVGGDGLSMKYEMANVFGGMVEEVAADIFSS